MDAAERSRRLHDAVNRHWGTAASYQPVTGPGADVTVIWGQSAEAVNFGHGGAVIGAEPVLEVSKAVIAAPGPGDIFEIDGVSWRVKGRPETPSVDGQLWRLSVERVVEA